jgi:hypothetical protein
MVPYRTAILEMAMSFYSLGSPFALRFGNPQYQTIAQKPRKMREVINERSLLFESQISNRDAGSTTIDGALTRDVVKIMFDSERG